LALALKQRFNVRKAQIYLETTIFNYYFNRDRDAQPYTVKLFEEIAKGRFVAFTSAYVVAELMKAPAEKRDRMLGLIENFEINLLGMSDEAEGLAAIYAREGAVPSRFLADGLHIAMTVVNDLDIIVSLNFKHIVKKKTMEMTNLINTREGYRQIQIFAPMEVVDD